MLDLLHVAIHRPMYQVSALGVTVIVILTLLIARLFRKPGFPENAPRPTSDSWPILGSLSFFTNRWDFYQDAVRQSKTGHFSFYAGNYPVVALSGMEGRKVFLESKSLSLAEGYGALLGGAPEVKRDNNAFAASHGDGDEFNNYFKNRLLNLLKGPQLKKRLPHMIQDARSNLDTLAADVSKITNPFDSIYRIVFQITMRMVACEEIADDPKLVSTCLDLFEIIEGSATPLSIMYPWLPLPSKVKRTYAGAKLYNIFQTVINDRKRLESKHDDALQYLTDQGDSVLDIITFVLGALFAGQLNSGINAAYILCYLTKKPDWLDRARQEVDDIANRHCADRSLPLKDRLMDVPLEAWESDFHTLDLCLKDTIRLQMSGAAFRRNISGKDVELGKGSTEVIPSGAYVTFAVGDMHYNPAIYIDPDEWDPSRYLPDRAEDKKETYGWMGWGVARHPCPGMRFAKLEINVIVAFFLAYFDDFQLCDRNGGVMEKVPACNRNNHTAQKPDQEIFLNLKPKSI